MNLVRLLAAEMVAGTHRDDVAKLIQSMDRQLNATPLPRGTDVNDARAGIAQARDLLRPYVMRLREQADVARAQDQISTSIGGSARPLVRSLKHLQ